MVSLCGSEQGRKMGENIFGKPIQERNDAMNNTTDINDENILNCDLGDNLYGDLGDPTDDDAFYDSIFKNDDTKNTMASLPKSTCGGKNNLYLPSINPYQYPLFSTGI